MKILSKYHDYYDSAAAYGVSEDYWKRENITSNHKDLALEDILHHAICWGGTPTIIMFCGTAHALIHLQGQTPTLESADFLVTKPEDFDTYRPIYEGGLRAPYMPRWPQLDEKPHRWRSDSSYAVRGFRGFMDDVAALDCEKYHREFNSPIISISRPNGPGQDYINARGRLRRMVRIETNPMLKAIGFQKVKDAFTAYQEIDSYLSGVLGVSPNPTVEISDVHRLEGHGFDKRTSFRNMKR